VKEIPECPSCGQLLAGASTPHGGFPRKGPFPDRSTGYCVNCHLGLTKIEGVWARTPTIRSA